MNKSSVLLSRMDVMSSENYCVKFVTLDKLKLFDFKFIKQINFDPSLVKDMYKSNHIGVRPLVAVAPSYEEEGKYNVLYGDDYIKAAMIAFKEDLSPEDTTIPVYFLNIKEKEAQDRAFFKINFKDLSAVNRGHYIKYLMDTYNDNTPYSCVSKMGISPINSSFWLNEYEAWVKANEIKKGSHVNQTDMSAARNIIKAKHNKNTISNNSRDNEDTDFMINTTIKEDDKDAYYKDCVSDLRTDYNNELHKSKRYMQNTTNKRLMQARLVCFEDLITRIDALLAIKDNDYIDSQRSSLNFWKQGIETDGVYNMCKSQKNDLDSNNMDRDNTSVSSDESDRKIDHSCLEDLVQDVDYVVAFYKALFKRQFDDKLNNRDETDERRKLHEALIFTDICKHLRTSSLQKNVIKELFKWANQYCNVLPSEGKRRIYNAYYIGDYKLNYKKDD